MIVITSYSIHYTKLYDAIRNGVDAKSANLIYDRMIKFANYAFNKPHAACYAMVSYRTAWLKIHYPVEFMAATMNSVMGASSKIAEYIHVITSYSIHYTKLYDLTGVGICTITASQPGLDIYSIRHFYACQSCLQNAGTGNNFV